MRSMFQAVVFVSTVMMVGTVWAQETPPPAEKDSATDSTDTDKPDSEESADDSEKATEKKPVTPPPAPTPPTPEIDLDEDDDELDEGWGDEEPEPVYPRVEHRGYFRFRADMFTNLHLGTQFQNNFATYGTSGFKPPLTENFINNDNPTFGADTVGSGNDETTLSSANMRMRYQPTILISDSLSIHATFDVLDNIVLGSTPDFHPLRPDVPFNAFSSAQAPPSDAFEIKDSIRVKELWGEWKLLGAPFRFGRMSSQWGLGMLSNGGNDWDDDYGDYYDRIMLSLQIYGVYIAGGYDIVSSGPTHAEPFQPFGQPYDMTETDDVQQGFVAIFSRPIQEHEIHERKNRLVKLRKPAIDWGLYTIYRTQQLDLSASSIQDNAATFDDMELVKRDAWAVVPDIWLRMEYRPSYKQRLRVELEAAMIYGKIGRVTEGTGDEERDIMSWGATLETEYTHGSLTFGVNAGVASGDDARGLTVLDQKNFEEDGKLNTKITNFKFDRNYHVDQILFREVIGTVTNAWYVKPYLQYDLFNAPDAAIGGQVGALYAQALEEDAYPGKDPNLGIELDTKIFFSSENKFYGDVSFGILFPGEAFTLRNGYLGDKYTGSDKSPEIAWTLQSHLVMKF
jgi:uncharacterized protein (TIGR04551 family)